MNTAKLAILLQILGLLLITTAGWIITPILGTALAGIGCLLFGVALERE